MGNEIITPISRIGLPSLERVETTLHSEIYNLTSKAIIYLRQFGFRGYFGKLSIQNFPSKFNGLSPSKTNQL